MSHLFPQHSPHRAFPQGALKQVEHKVCKLFWFSWFFFSFFLFFKGCLYFCQRGWDIQYHFNLERLLFSSLPLSFYFNGGRIVYHTQLLWLCAFLMVIAGSRKQSAVPDTHCMLNCAELWWLSIQQSSYVIAGLWRINSTQSIPTLSCMSCRTSR